MSEGKFSQLAWFKAYAASGRAPRWMMEPTDIHGFLTGLAMTGPVPDAEWMSWIWSGEEPQFESEDEEWNVLSDLLSFEAQIRQSLSAYRIVTPAVLPCTEDGLYFAADWAEGFFQAIEANPQPWQKAVELAESSLQIVLTACYHNHDDENGGYMGHDGMDELNYHLRHLNRIMQSQTDHLWQGAKAA